MAKSIPQKNDGRLTFRFSDKFIQIIKIEAIKRNISATELAQNAIEEYLRKNK